MIYCFDLDGVICTRRITTYEKCKPNKKIIKHISSLYNQGHTILIYTGRGVKDNTEWGELTYKQLRNWGVKYHRVIFGKPHSDINIDDKTINIHAYIKLLDNPNKIKILQDIVDRDRLTKPHRKHLYQIFANEKGVAHWKVSSGYGLIQLIVGLSMLFMRQFGIYIILLILVVYFCLFVLISFQLRKKWGTAIIVK